MRQLITRSDDHPALLVPGTPDVALSYAGLHRALDRAAARLASLGVGQGDRVALAATGPALVLAFLSVTARGAAAAPLNPALGPAELTAELTGLAVSRLLHDGPGAAGQAAAAARVPASVIRFADGLLHIDGQAGSPADGPADGQAGSPADDQARPAPGNPDALALLLHTSGTTSKPKTVPIRHRNLIASATTVARTYRLSGDDVTMCVMPLFHVHGLVATVLATLATGGTVVLSGFHPATFWADAARCGATWYTAVPTIHSRLLDQLPDRDANQPEEEGRPEEGDQPAGRPPLRFARSCSAPLPRTLWRRFEEATGVPLAEAYGMTEAAHQMAANPLPPAQRRPGTVGRATGVEIAILDEAWVPLPAGAEGEVAVRGPSVVTEYLGNPEATAAAFRDGWFRTGDVGRLSADGYLTLTGRVKELINRAGEKISPYEVEDVLLSHPAVADAAAYPVPDAEYGEQVGAVVVLRSPATPEQLAGHCASQLAAFKRPVRLTVLPEIPKGPTGKVQRRNLAALVAQ